MPLARRPMSLTLTIVLAVSACQEAPEPEQNAAPAPSIANQESTPPTLIEPANWPLQQAVMLRDPAAEQRIEAMISRMTLEEKVGQIVQADIASVTPEQVRQYNLGSVLNGGGSAPDGGRGP